MNATDLTLELNALVTVARGLPPQLVRQVADFAEFLGRKHAAPPVQESDEWGDENVRDIAITSLRRFESEHPDDDWGTDFTTPERKEP